jgi:hypothetical protein
LIGCTVAMMPLVDGRRNFGESVTTLAVGQ